MVVGLLIGLQWLQENIQKQIMNENLEVIHVVPSATDHGRNHENDSACSNLRADCGHPSVTDHGE